MRSSSEVALPAWVQGVTSVCVAPVVVAVCKGCESVSTLDQKLVDAAIDRVLRTANVAVRNPPCGRSPEEAHLALTLRLDFKTDTYVKEPGRPSSPLDALPFEIRQPQTCFFPTTKVELLLSRPGRPVFQQVVQDDSDFKSPERVSHCSDRPSYGLSWQRPILAALAAVWSKRIVAAARLDVGKNIRDEAERRHVMEDEVGLLEVAERMDREAPIPVDIALPYVIVGLKSDDGQVVQTSAAWGARLKPSATDLCPVLVDALRKNRVQGQADPAGTLFKAVNAVECNKLENLRIPLKELAVDAIEATKESSRHCERGKCVDLWNEGALLLGRLRAGDALPVLVALLDRTYPENPPAWGILDAITEIGVGARYAADLTRVLNRSSGGTRIGPNDPWEHEIGTVERVRRWGPISVPVLCKAVKSRDPDVQREARAAITEAASAALPCLSELRADEEPEVRMWARNAIKNVRRPAAEAHPTFRKLP